jgi:CMP-N-acetylneuraminic acid synthetase
MPVPTPQHPVSWTAVIPLRGGSKGLPGKNTRLLAGKPLYRHAVDLALAAGASRVLLSTDISQVLSASHPPSVQTVQRPPELCGDAVPMAPVLLHALQAAQVNGAVVLLQATSPLRQVADVQAALQQLASGSFDLVMSVTEADRGVLKWGQLQADGRFVPLSKPEHCFANRQSLPPVYKPNGAVYALQASWFIANQGFVSERIGTVVMPPERSHDIDTLADFERCEAIYLGAPSTPLNP